MKKKIAVKPLTAKRLREVKNQILKEPKQFVMDHFYTLDPSYVDKVPNCGTAGCIAGWGAALKERINPRKAINRFGDSGSETEPLACEFFGITETQGEYLFFVSNWPSDYEVAYEACEFSPSLRAQVTAERIEYFIEHGE